MTRPAYDVDLDAWKNRSAFHPANTRLKQLGHELARKAVVHLGELLHWLLPPGPEKSIAFQRLDEVRLYANMALAVNGGPREMAGSAEYTEAAIAASLRDYERVELPGDPRIKEYEAEQRGERPSLPGAAPDAPRQGMTGVAVQQADYAAIPGEKPTAPADRFEWSGGQGSLHVEVRGLSEDSPAGGAVTVLLTDVLNGTSLALVLESPFKVNEFLSAVAAAGDRAFQ